MSRKIRPLPEKKLVKELPAVASYQKQKQQQKTFGDLSPEQKQEFIFKHLTNRNFVASVPFNKNAKKELEKIAEDDNRRIMIQNVVDADDIVKSRKLVKKVVKKVVNVET